MDNPIQEGGPKYLTMYYVYILKSLKVRDRFYIGLTSNLKRRLNEHDDPSSDNYTYRYLPWKLETYVVFENDSAAKKFESYLKTSSGRTFLKRHFI
jgi:predicted GIY-YIG superfamily endonuclease